MGGQDPLLLAYHDEEWGVPVHDDNRLFEMLVLESMQSGLSWLTILRKRKAFQAAFRQFDPGKVAKFGAKEVEKLLANADIIRNRAKVDATIANARATLRAQEKYGSLDTFLWRAVDGKPLVHAGRIIIKFLPKPRSRRHWPRNAKKMDFALSVRRWPTP